MTPAELQRYGERNGVLISREVSRGIADFRDELGQTVELDGLIEEINEGKARVRVMLQVGRKPGSGPMFGVMNWICAEDLEPFEGISLWAEGLVRKNLRKRNGEEVSEPRTSPFWAEL